MKYLLSEDYHLRGWQRLPFALYDSLSSRTIFLPKDRFMLMYRCDGRHDIDLEKLSAELKAFLDTMLQSGVIREADGGTLSGTQRYHEYPCRFRESAQWSVTGHCNYRCRHCFMSAPDAVCTELDTAQCLSVVRQLAECGIHRVSLTGGEPLIRRDFPEIVRALAGSGITVTELYTNGALLDEDILRLFSSLGMSPSVHISFDGPGVHDWMRGTAGAEEAALRAFRLCADEGFRTSSSMCLCRENAGLIRSTVRLLSEHGCSALKINKAVAQGLWSNEKEHWLSDEECFAAYADYIPQFFEDGAPMWIMLDGMFLYSPADGRSTVPFVRGSDESSLLCGHVRTGLYIGAEGQVLPCMSMAGTGCEKDFPNLFETPLCEILIDSYLTRAGEFTCGDFLSANPGCRDCAYAKICAGGCRALAVAACGDYLSPDRKACAFFRSGMYEKTRDIISAYDNRQ